MKYLHFILFLSIVGIGTIQAQQDSVSNTTATVYFYRLPNYVGSAVKMKIQMNGTPVVKLGNNSFYKQTVPSGEYIISCNMGAETKIKLILEPSKIYYLKCYINMGFWSGIPVIELMDSTAGKAIIAGGSLEETQYKPISAKRNPNRIGINFGAGGGFESNNLFVVDENGDNVSLSAGGGLTIGAEFGHEFNKYFDLSFNLNYRYSSLSQNLKNAEASFSRMEILATPALIIPIKGGEFFRFRLGAGPGLYSLGTMFIDDSKLANGSKYTFKYKTAIGFQGSFIFESNFSDNASYSMGLHYTNVNYNYTRQGSSHLPGNEKIEKPDGSGIDFTFGFYYRF